MAVSSTLSFMEKWVQLPVRAQLGFGVVPHLANRESMTTRQTIPEENTHTSVTAPHMPYKDAQTKDKQHVI